MLTIVVIKSLVAGLLASLACGVGALPALLRGVNIERHTGLGYAFAGGLMFAASVYNLILPGLRTPDSQTPAVAQVTPEANADPTQDPQAPAPPSGPDMQMSLRQVLPVIGGILLGTVFLWAAGRFLPEEREGPQAWDKWGGRTGVLIFIAMCVHSIPEGVAVGVGYASEGVYHNHLGSYIALAIAIHNMPEGLAVALPMRAAGASGWTCFVAAFLTSLPQPIAAVPASIASWFFQPLMPVLMGFAAGAMIFLVLMEMIPSALDTEKPVAIGWSFMAGFCLMLLIQVVL